MLTTSFLYIIQPVHKIVKYFGFKIIDSSADNVYLVKYEFINLYNNDTHS